MRKRTLRFEELTVDTFATGARPNLRALAETDSGSRPGCTVMTTCSPSCCDSCEETCVGEGGGTQIAA